MANVYESVLASGGSTPTDITPSNSSPAAMSADGVYKATAAGYAIESYSSVTPSNSSPVTLTSGDIVKLEGSGKAISSYSTKTPSNSSPVSLTSGSIYKMGGSGKAVASITDITPADYDPPQVSTDGVYKMSAAGYVTASTTETVAPSDLDPPQLQGFHLYLTNGQSGYLYRNIQTGVMLNPAQMTKTLVKNSSTTLNVQAGKHYIVVAIMRASGTDSRGGSWYVIGGTGGGVTVLQNDSNSNANVSINSAKTAITLTATQATYSVEFRVITLNNE